MNYRLLMEIPEIEWPNWETRFGGDGPVRQVAFDPAASVPEAPAKRPEGPETVNTARLNHASPSCPGKWAGAGTNPKGLKRVQCSKCKAVRVIFK